MNVSTRLLLVIGAISFAACGGNSAPPANTSTPPSPSASTSSPTSSSNAEFGVAECDSYIKLYMACLDRMPAATRAQAQQAFDQTKASWKQAASTEQGRAALAMTCKMASDAAAPAMRAQGCSW